MSGNARADEETRLLGATRTEAGSLRRPLAVAVASSYEHLTFPSPRARPDKRGLPRSRAPFFMTSTPTAPTAERRPHTTTQHGITLTDDYAWLKDANWQQVLRDPVDPRPGYPQLSRGRERLHRKPARPTEALQKTLVAEMRGRIKEDNSSVPSPDGPFAYFAKFREGGQHEMFGRSRATAATPHSARRRRTRRRTKNISSSAARGIRRITGSKPGAPTSRARNIFRSGCATGPAARTLTMSSRRPTAAWSGARTASASSTSSSTTITARCRSGVIASARRRPRTCWSMRNRIPAGSPISMRAPAAASA